MDGGKFQDALEREETDEFFLGRGRYFIHNKEYDEHAYYSAMLNAITLYAEGSSEKQKHVLDCFARFIHNSMGNIERSEAILKNIFALLMIENRGLLLNGCSCRKNYLLTKALSEYLKSVNIEERYDYETTTSYR
jgi:hypothetical protein